MQQLTIGTVLRGGSYKIEKVLGQGSFGITYLAEHTNLGRKVAIKEFFMKELNSRGEDGSITGMTDGSLSQNYCVKFQKEAINLSRLDHPNIVRVTDSFSENGTFYYVMEYIDGQNLNDYVKSHLVDEAEAVSIIKSVADALIYMHEEKHMLHLDLKPGNVMRRNSDGHIFLIDFGLSKYFSEDGQPETSTTIGLGTAGYAPIEQGNKAKNGEFRPTIDVYALGATFYKLLTRETPPPASDLVSDDELLENNLRAKGVSDNLIKVVVEAMCPSEKRRTQNIRSFKYNISNSLVEESTTIEDGQNYPLIGIDKDDRLEEAVRDFMSFQSGDAPDSADEDSSPANAGIEAPRKYSIFSFKGRVGRLKYLAASWGGYIALLCLIGILISVMGEEPKDASTGVCMIASGLFYLLYILLSLTVGAKRCHDLEHSGWFQLIPFYGFVLLFASGDIGENKYGEKGNGISKKSLKVLGAIVLAIICLSTCAIALIGEDKAKMYGKAEDIIEGHVVKDSIIQQADSAAALPSIQELADKKYGPAMWMLAQYYENGSAGIPQDTIQAQRLCEQAFPILLKEAEEGDMYSQCALGLLYEDGKVTQANYEKAFSWMDKSAEQGYGDALGNLAVFYLYGTGCDQNEQKAFQYMLKARDVNVVYGESLAEMYLEGIGTPIDTAKAISIYEELADMGHSSSQTELGHIYFEQNQYHLALPYLFKAEKEDDMQSIQALAWMYYNGYGVAENRDKAISYLLRAYELSDHDPRVLYLIGYYYEGKDEAKAFAYMKESAEEGVPEAQYRLALYYQNGYGIKVNERLAYKWYKKAIANGFKE